MTKKTKTITITQYDYLIKNINDEEVDVHGHKNHFTELDEEGRPLREINYTQDGLFEDMVACQYDSAGRLLRESYYPAEDELAEEIVFTHGDSGRTLQAKKNYQDGSVDTIDFEYNASGQLIKKVTTNDDGEVEQSEIFEYENDHLVKHETYDSDGDLVSAPHQETPVSGEMRVTHNEAGQIISEEELNDEGEVIMSVHRVYNAEGKPDEVEVHLDGEGRKISRHYILKYEYTYFD